VPIYVPGPYTPTQVRTLVRAHGVDQFDTSYAYAAAEHGRLLILDGIDGNVQPIDCNDIKLVCYCHW
jgi:queuine/archaeosine tRNA-ribosyltransferase